MALYGHRYLENGIAPIIAKKIFKNSAYSQILVGGSNFGELCGAFTVFLLNDIVPTPIPWLRADSMLLLIVWCFPFFYPPAATAKYAWLLALVSCHRSTRVHFQTQITNLAIIRFSRPFLLVGPPVTFPLQLTFRPVLLVMKTRTIRSPHSGQLWPFCTLPILLSTPFCLRPWVATWTAT